MSNERHFITDRILNAVLVTEVPVNSCSYFMSKRDAWEFAKKRAQASKKSQNPAYRVAVQIVFEDLTGMRTVVMSAEDVANLSKPAPKAASTPTPTPAEPAPAPAPKAEVPAGRYAIDTETGIKFYVVDRPTQGKWKGYTFVKAQASDDLYPVRNRQQRENILAAIAVDPKAASVLYGRELGVCGVCNRTLTDQTSRENGIGPICAKNTGW